MSKSDIDRLCVLDLACMKHCGKQLPILTLKLVIDFVHEYEKNNKKVKPKLPRYPHCPDAQDLLQIVVKGARKKKWTPRRENRQCATQFRMRRAFRYNI